MKFKSTLTKIAEAMIAPLPTSATPTAPTAPPTAPTTAAPKTLVPVKDNTAEITELEKEIKNLPNDYPKKSAYLIKIDQLRQTAELEKRLYDLLNPPKLENTLTPFYTMLSRAYKTLNEAGPEDLSAAQPADAAMPQPADPNAAQPAAASQPPPAPAPSPDEVDKSGKTVELENDSNKIVLVGILNRVLSELLKHQNEVRANSNSEEPEKESANIRAKALTQLINTTTSENLATSKLNGLIKHIKSEFYLIYPTGKNKVEGDNSEQTKRGELINIIIGILNELLKHQNEVVTNTATDVPSKASAGRRSESLKRLIDHIGADKSELNILLQYIQSQFNQIYPVS